MKNPAHMILSILPAMVSLFWAITLLFNQSQNSTPKKWLGIFMIATFVLYSCHALVFLGKYETYFHVKSIYHFVGLSVYPLFFNYIQLMSSKKRVRFSFLWHLVPALVIVLLFSVFSMGLNQEEIKHYIEFLIPNLNKSSSDVDIPEKLYYTFKLSRVIFALQVILYTFLILKLIKTYNKKVLEFYSNVHGKNLYWLKGLAYSMLVIGFMGFLFNIIGRSYFTHGNLVVIPSLIFSTLLYVVGLQGDQNMSYVAEMEIGTEQENVERGVDVPLENKNQVDVGEMIRNKIDMVMEKEKCYLEPDFKITDLALRVGTNRSYISNIINSSYQMHFNKFINQYRIEYAKNLMQNPENKDYTLAYIAESSGFGSLSTFNRSFKELERMTPCNYREKQTTQLVDFR